MRSVALGQNFLKNRRTARRVAHLAGPDDLLCVDLGAGNGVITDACLLRSGPILAIEVDPRLVRQLRERFANEPRVTVQEDDLLAAELPSGPFVIAANPPFNVSTKLVHRWLLHRSFMSGALIVERPFARRVSGDYGATKLSLSIAAFLDLKVPFGVRAAEFSPHPRTDAAILTATRRSQPAVPWSQRVAYWSFVNYLFERSRLTVGEALEPLRLRGLPAAIRSRAVRDLGLPDAVELYHACVEGPTHARVVMADFEVALPPSRRVALENSAVAPLGAQRRTPEAATVERSKALRGRSNIARDATHE